MVVRIDHEITNIAAGSIFVLIKTNSKLNLLYLININIAAKIIVNNGDNK